MTPDNPKPTPTQAEYELAGKVCCAVIERYGKEGPSALEPVAQLICESRAQSTAEYMGLDSEAINKLAYNIQKCRGAGLEGAVDFMEEQLQFYRFQEESTAEREVKDERFEDVCAFACSLLDSTVFGGQDIDGADIQAMAEDFNIIETRTLTQAQVDSDDYNTEEFDLGVGDPFCHINDLVLKADQRHEARAAKKGGK